MYGRSDVDGTVLALAMLPADRVEAAVLVVGDRTQVLFGFPLVPHAVLDAGGRG